MFTIIGAMAELESSLISERVSAGMKAAETRGKHLGRPATSQRLIAEIESLAKSTDSAFARFREKCEPLRRSVSTNGGADRISSR
jgi:DNA invertase Pin-like site-specific DNA recombinase